MMSLALGEESVGGGRQQVGEVGFVVAVARSASGLPQHLQLAGAAIDNRRKDGAAVAEVEVVDVQPRTSDARAAVS
jgi:hypothetical protein